MLKKAFISIFTLMILSCAQVTSLNLKKHQFGIQPSKIIWIQVAGLDEDHFALIKYSPFRNDPQIALERSLCSGKAWNYNLYKIRPNSYEGLQSQITGKKDVKKECSDFKHRPIWSYLVQNGYSSLVLDNQSDKNFGLYSSLKCNGHEEYLKDTLYMRMAPQPNDVKSPKWFHANETQVLSEQGIYYDRSCQKGDCYSSLLSNSISLFERFTKNKNYYIFVVRDFSYEESLKAKNVKNMQKKLDELDKLLTYFFNYTEKRNDTLLLISSSAPLQIEFPEMGAQWQKLDERGQYLTFKQQSLQSVFYAAGARSENFCGLTEEASLFERILSGPKQQGLDFVILNPFI